MIIKKLFLLGIYVGFAGFFIGITCNIWTPLQFWINFVKTSGVVLLFSCTGFVVNTVYLDHKAGR